MPASDPTSVRLEVTILYHPSKFQKTSPSDGKALATLHKDLATFGLAGAKPKATNVRHWTSKRGTTTLIFSHETQNTNLNVYQKLWSELRPWPGHTDDLAAAGIISIRLQETYPSLAIAPRKPCILKSTLFKSFRERQALSSFSTDSSLLHSAAHREESDTSSLAQADSFLENTFGSPPPQSATSQLTDYHPHSHRPTSLAHIQDRISDAPVTLSYNAQEPSSHQSEWTAPRWPTSLSEHSSIATSHPPPLPASGPRLETPLATPGPARIPNTNRTPSAPRAMIVDSSSRPAVKREAVEPNLWSPLQSVPHGAPTASQSSHIVPPFPPQPPPAPQPASEPTTEAFTNELTAIQLVIRGAVNRERYLLEELNKRGIEKQPERPAECEEIVASERMKRVALEKDLEAIREECRYPFVVPKLLDAFLAMERVAQQALDPTAAGAG